MTRVYLYSLFLWSRTRARSIVFELPSGAVFCGALLAEMGAKRLPVMFCVQG